MPKKKSPHPVFEKINKSLEKISMADLSFELEKDLNRGLSSDDLRKKYQPRLTAKSILMALASDNEVVATANIKDVTDRTEGRASEKSRIPNPLEKLTDAQLEALLRTEIGDLKDEVSPDLH